MKSIILRILGVLLISALIHLFAGGNSVASSNVNTNKVQSSPTTEYKINTATISSVNKQDNLKAVVHISCDNNSAGSGTIMLESGDIITNNHVIRGATKCIVTIPDAQTGQPAEIYVGTPAIVPTLSEKYDIAVVVINSAYTDSDGKTWGVYPKKFTAFTNPNSCSNKTPSMGDSLRIYGYPVTSGGYNLTITDGIVSSLPNNDYILTSAKIDSGNSGGLALSEDGCFVGIPSAVLTGNFQNLGVIISNDAIISFFKEANSDNLKLQTQVINPPVQSDQNNNYQTSKNVDSLIDCIGPDGKHLHVTQQECDTFNNAWKPSPTPDPNSYWGY